MREDGLERGFILGKTPGAERILLYDDFEGLLKWKSFGEPAGYSVTKNPFQAYNGNVSMQLQTRVRGALPGDYVHAYRFIPSFGKTVHKLEVIWNPAGASRCRRVGFEFLFLMGGVTYEFGVVYEVETLKWRYFTGWGFWVDVPGGGQSLLEGSWHRLSVLFDARALKYGNLYSDGDLIPASGLDACSIAWPASDYCYVRFFVDAGVSAPGIALFDDVLIRRV